jgi:hypothetical protein
VGSRKNNCGTSPAGEATTIKGGDMTKEEYFEFQNQFFQKAMDLTKKKNADYTGASDDPFANFRRIGQANPSWVLVGFLTRMTDKFARLESFVQNGLLQVKEESVEDTLLDLANYSSLLAGYLKSHIKPMECQMAVERVDLCTPIPQARL